MRLYYNATSPYARKVRVVLHEKGLFDQVEQRLADPWTDAPELHAAAPVGKVPALVTDDGLTLSESTTIAEYLDSLPTGRSLIGDDRWPVMARASLGQGLIDASFAILIEGRRPEERRWPEAVARHRRAIERIIGTAEAEVGRFDFGDIALACGLAYMDFRVPDMPWRKARPDLAAWLDEANKRPSMQATKPA
ncbi:MAG TPA: glutathione S-transferase [Alphaproteobacteria bacterium]|jgi:glutathione S-transferase